MNESYEKEKLLAEKYINKYNLISPDKDPMRISIPQGWYDLVCELTDNLIDAGWERTLYQIKEKFGGLRFYIATDIEELQKIILAAEDASYSICPVCGELKSKVECHELCSKKNYW